MKRSPPRPVPQPVYLKRPPVSRKGAIFGAALILSPLVWLCIATWGQSPATPATPAATTPRAIAHAADPVSDIASVGNTGIFTRPTIACPSWDTWNALVSAAVAQDKVGFEQAYANGDCITAPRGTEALVIDAGFISARIRIGDQEQTYWLETDSTNGRPFVNVKSDAGKAVKDEADEQTVRAKRKAEVDKEFDAFMKPDGAPPAMTGPGLAKRC
jgi:hypothetical protein